MSRESSAQFFYEDNLFDDCWDLGGDIQAPSHPNHLAQTLNNRRDNQISTHAPNVIKQQDMINQEKPFKTKHIQKDSKPKKRRRSKYQEHTQRTTGRPVNNRTEENHLEKNRSLNDVVYHYARLLIFFRLEQGTNPQTHLLRLQTTHNQILLQTQKIMKTENFPSFEEEIRPEFLLHSNSLHFVFQQHCKGKRRKYSVQELKIMFLGFLQAKHLLCTQNYQYVLDYWDDIINLVENPEGSTEVDEDSKRVQSPEYANNNRAASTPQESIQSESNEQAGITPSQSQDKKGPSERLLLSKKLRTDPSVAAYEIACYLHACQQKYKFLIVPSK